MKSLTVGGATIDTIAIIASDRIERMSMLNADSSFLLLKEGSKTEATEVSTHTGGGAVNSAVGMSRLGLDVSALVKLGKDARAETVLARLMAEGISTRWAVRDGRAPTGASVMVSSHDRNAAVFTFRGANTLLESADIKDEAFAVDLVHVASLSNKSAERFPEIIGKAKRGGRARHRQSRPAPARRPRPRVRGLPRQDRHPLDQPVGSGGHAAVADRPLRRRRSRRSKARVCRGSPSADSTAAAST